MRSAMVPVVAARPDELVDTCGTGGGALTTFNISTAASFVAAAAGVRIAKHGNRSHTSRSGSADVLEALGIRIDLDAATMGTILDQVGMVFMFAPLLHPAMRHVAGVRRRLGVPTIFNVLGPLTNPAGAQRQVVGVYDPSLSDLVIEALRELGHRRALVVHGAPGMDEISPLGETRITELREGRVQRYAISPEDLGLEPGRPEELTGGSPEENAALLLEVLSGSRKGGARDAILLNAAGAVFVAGFQDSLSGALQVAEEAVESGGALRKLQELRQASHV